MSLCREVGAAPYLAANLRSATAKDFYQWVEYCNAPAGTKWTDLRVQHGYASPHGIKYWCLGNEMDGPWQIGALSAIEYAKKARESAKVMRWQDATIQTIACGSSTCSGPSAPRYRLAPPA